jgi:hypothetical protein
VRKLILGAALPALASPALAADGPDGLHGVWTNIIVLDQPTGAEKLGRLGSKTYDSFRDCKQANRYSAAGAHNECVFVPIFAMEPKGAPAGR